LTRILFETQHVCRNRTIKRFLTFFTLVYYIIHFPPQHLRSCFLVDLRQFIVESGFFSHVIPLVPYCQRSFHHFGHIHYLVYEVFPFHHPQQQF
jgi:hypothetical protein